MTIPRHRHEPAEGQITRCPVMRWSYVVLGFLCIGLAVVGAVLPVMPTTVFVLMAAACFARGSKRFEDWLLSSAWFGPMVRSWRTSRSIPARAKRIALVMIAVTFTISVLIVPFLWLKLTLPVMGICVGWCIGRLPTAEAIALRQAQPTPHEQPMPTGADLATEAAATRA